jgi:NhaP-type Na+/H+ and K+/H+ antiporter
MRPRLLAPGLAIVAILADAVGAHGPAYWLVLCALPVAATASFTGISDGLEGLGWLRGLCSSLALVFLVLGSAVRETAPAGASVPALAVSATVIALIWYAVPGVAWLFSEPMRSLRTATPTRRAARA